MTDKTSVKTKMCTLKTAYKYDKKYQDIRGNCYNYNNQLNKFETTNRKNKPITNACNAIHVCDIIPVMELVGYARKSVWWMPWH